MKEYIINFYRLGEVKFIKSVQADDIKDAFIKAEQLFKDLKYYDEYGLSTSGN